MIGFRLVEKTTEKNQTEVEEIKEMIDEAINEAERMAASETETAGTSKVIENTVPIVHKWFQSDDVRQKMVQYAYKLWGIDFVTMIECENGNWSLSVKGDSWHAHGLCQMNDRYHKDIPAEYSTNWVVAVEYCYQKYSTGTKFYWPSRRVKWKKCANYVLNRFIINDAK